MSEQKQTRKKSSSTSSPAFTPRTGLIQRKCACGGSAGVDGECAECRGKRLSVQRSPTTQAEPAASVPPVVHDVLSSPGQPLDSDTRAYMEPRFGHDFSQVRVHTDGKAAESAQAINALAYTAGRDIAFGEGQYGPETNEGKKLLAHELTHVVQQSGQSQGTVNRLSIGQPGDNYEREAEGISASVLHDQEAVRNPFLPSELHLQRQAAIAGDTEAEAPEAKVAGTSTSAARSPEVKAMETKMPETKSVETKATEAKSLESRATETKTSGAKVPHAQTDDEAVREIIRKFPLFVQNQIGNIENQKEFLRVMPRYLGPDPNTENHFKDGEVRPAEVPGHPWLHRSAAERLEAVKRDLGDAMPDTDVGLGLRDRFHTHTRYSKSKMAHPLGYAIDYRATVNPMITDPRLVKLLDLETGGATHFDLGMKKTERRELIMQMGKGDVAPESDEAVKFFHRFESEYTRVSQASAAFTSSLPEKTTLSALKNDYLKVRAELNQVDKNLVSLNKQLAARAKSARKAEKADDQAEQKLQERKQELETKKLTLENQLVEIQNKLPKLLKPWLDRIKVEQARIEKEVPNIHGLPSKEELNKEETEVKSRSRSVLKSKRAVEREIKRLEARIDKDREKGKKGKEQEEKTIADLNAALGKAKLEAMQKGEEETTSTERLEEIKRLRNLLPKKADLSVLESLEEALTKNLDFVFGTSKELAVKDPSVTQLVEKGFFTPDPEKGSKKHGFNLAFMKIMAQHGFDQGINWSPGSVDPMHFELVEGVESILDGKEPGKNEEKKQTNNKGL